ncbi:MAG TPA: serine/threonine-protein kinase, partial [Holophagaceae bacterium]
MTHPPQDPEAHPDPEAAQPLPAGTQIGRFRIEASLGAGGMGQVYRAWDATLERSVALKALRPGGDQDAGALERFHREAMALAQLNHPHVCQVHDWVETTAGTYIAMELVAGETLDQTAARLRTRDKLAVLLAVARALEAAHAKGLIHRDLKPANIMVSVAPGARPDVKVLDFGLARLLDAQGEQATPAPVPNLSRPLVAPERLDEATAIRSDAGSPPDQTFRGPSGGPSWDRLTQAGAFMGSPAYASPEQIQGQPAGPASDVFSLGILGWELLTGEPPFPGKGRARIQATLHGRLRPFKGHGAPRAVAELLTGMLDPHPFRRPTAAQVAKTLERLLKPRSALRWALASAAAALLLAGGGFFFLSRGILSGFGTGRPVRLLVLPFGNATGNPDLEVVAQHAIPEMLEAALRQQTRLLPLSADALVQARAALHLPAQDALRPAEETRLASALGADLILRGSLVPDDKGVL